MEKLTHQEEEAMRYIWKIGMCCVKDILKCYPEPGLPYTTLASCEQPQAERVCYGPAFRKYLYLSARCDSGRICQNFGRHFREELFCRFIQRYGIFLCP